jgi:hypothetical protein
MLPHGSEKLADLAAQCVVTPLDGVNGWGVDVWDMTASDVDLAVEIYQAVVTADMTAGDPVVQALASQGIDLLALLADPGHGRELVTRADIAEYAAAASLIASDGFASPSMHMPNIPKLARRKSESGIDVFDVKLHQGAGGVQLGIHERLGLASVKHTLTDAASNLRLAIAKSLSGKHDLTQAYLAAQLRHLAGRLKAEGMAHADAARVTMFMANFPDPTSVGMFGIAVVDPQLRADMIAQLASLPVVRAGHKFRIITFPTLDTVHARCP